MAEWCLEHPWMTFFLVLAALAAFETLCKAIAASLSGR